MWCHWFWEWGCIHFAKSKQNHPTPTPPLQTTKHRRKEKIHLEILKHSPFWCVGLNLHNHLTYSYWFSTLSFWNFWLNNLNYCRQKSNGTKWFIAVNKWGIPLAHFLLKSALQSKSLKRYFKIFICCLRISYNLFASYLLPTPPPTSPRYISFLENCLLRVGLQRPVLYSDSKLGFVHQ